MHRFVLAAALAVSAGVYAQTNTTVQGMGTPGTPRGGTLTVQGCNGDTRGCTPVPVTGSLSVSGAADTVGLSATFNANSVCATVAIAGQTGAGFFLGAGSPVATFTPSVSKDNTNWTPTSFVDVSGNTSATIVNPSGFQDPGIVVRAGDRFARVCTTAYTSGSASGFLVATTAAPRPPAAGADVTDRAARLLGQLTDGTSAIVPAKTGQLPAALDGSGFLKVHEQGTAAISASSLPLPTGAATSAKQPVLGTAGAASTDVITVQGIAAGTPIDENIKNVGGNAVATGNGTTSTGTQRVTLSSDSTGQVAIAGTATVAGTVTANQGGAPWTEDLIRVGGTAVLTGNGATGAGSPRVTVANDNAAIATKADQTAPTTATWTSATTVDTAATLTVKNYGIAAVSFHASGSITTGTINFECSDDARTTWYACQLSRTGSAATPDTTYVLTGANQLWQLNVGAMTDLRVRLNPVITGAGSALISLQASAAAAGGGGASAGGGGGGGSVTQGTSPWIVAGGGTAGTAATGVVTVQGIASMTPVKVDGSGVTQPVSGTVTANIGTSGSLALDASVTGLQVSQGSTTSGQKGDLTQGAVTTASPSYTTGQTSPVSLNTSGGLRVDGSAVTQPVSGSVTANVGTTNGLALDAVGRAQGSTTSGQTGPIVQGAVTTSAPTYTNAQTDPLSLTTAGALRTDSSATTQPVSGTVTANAGTGTFNIQANASVNGAQVNGVTTQTGAGTAGTGTQRVAVATSDGVVLSTANSGRLQVDVVTGGGGGGGSADTAGTLVTLNAACATGASCAAGSTAQVALAGMTGVNFTLQNPATPVGFTLVADCSFDGATTWELTGSPSTSGVLNFETAAGAISNTLTSMVASRFAIPQTCEGATHARVRVAARTSGAIDGQLRATANGAQEPTYAGMIGANSYPPNAVALMAQDSGTATTSRAVTATANGVKVDVAASVLPTGAATGVTQGSTTSGQSGTLAQGAVTTSAPSYTTAQTSPVSLDTSGNLRVAQAVSDSTASGSVSVQCSDANINSCGASSTVSIALAGQFSASVTIPASSTLVTALKPDCSSDGGTTWKPTYFDDPALGSVSSYTTVSGTANSLTVVGCGGFSHVRVRASSSPTGSGTISLRAGFVSDPSVLFAGPADSTTQPPRVAQMGGWDGTALRALSADNTFKALHVSQRPPEVLGCWALGGSQAYTATTAGGIIFSFRWGDATRIALVLKVQVMVVATAFGGTAGLVERQLVVVRPFTASDTGGTSVLPAANKNELRTSFPTTLLTDARFGGFLTAGTGTPDAQPLATVANWMSAVGNVIGNGQPVTLFDATGGFQHPLVLVQNEGFRIQLNATEAASTRQTFVNIVYCDATAF
jgi:hypothetical protein